MLNKFDVLKTVFNYDNFRNGQDEIIDTIVNNNNGVLVTMATGGGKSLLYQIPAIMGTGLSIVISPLISLMKDQVDFLKSKNISAEFYNSSLSQFEKTNIINKIANQQIKLLYIAPERFEDSAFIPLLKSTNQIDYFAVDEAHCISTWGQDFRPSFRILSSVIERLEPKQVIALTATATKIVQEDICDKLNIKYADRFIKGFYRNDLKLNIQYTDKDYKDNQVIDLVEYLVKKGNTTGIIYCPTRKSTELIGTLIKKRLDVKFNVYKYHAGLKDSEREQIQTDWMKNGGIVIATIAFGLGIDKPDVRFVIHNGLPGSIEAYYQEIGRASRDGKGAVCTLFYTSPGCARLQHFFIDLSNPPKSSLETLWAWLLNEADEYDMVYATQKVMEKDCSGMNGCHVGGCINKFKKNNFVETIGRGKYKIDHTKNIEIDFNFDDLELKRKIKIEILLNMISLVKTNSVCRMLQILKYFGDEHTEVCGKCDVCTKPKK